MGRMLDALSRTRGRSLPSSRQGVTAVAEAELAAVPNPEIETEDDDSVPFIEVGGPAPKMKHLPAPTPGPTHITLVPVPEPKPKPEPLKSLWFEPDTGVKYLSVLYQPVPEIAPLVEDKPLAEDLVTHYKPEHPVSVQYRSIWREMAEQLKFPRQALLFTSAHDHSGTSTVLLNLAITILREPAKQVLVVDANPASPAVFARLGIAPAPGLHELLHRGLPTPLAVHRTRLPGLSVMVCGNGEGNRGTADRDRLARLLAQLRSRFDWVLIDAPKWSEEGIGVWADICDAAFLVLRQTDSAHPDVEAAHDLLYRDGKLKGYLLTRN